MTLRLDDLRLRLIAAQGFATRGRKATKTDVGKAVERPSCVQREGKARDALAEPTVRPRGRWAFGSGLDPAARHPVLYTAFSLHRPRGQA